jgi:Uma2 family endonuclease
VISVLPSMSAAEFARTGPETDDCELIRGKVVRFPLPTALGGAVCTRIAILLGGFKKSRGRGCVLSNHTGFITSTNPDSVRAIDVAFFLNSPWTGPTPDRFLTEAPDLAVEVRSEDQPWKALLEKANEYLKMGTRMVWIIDPKTERMTVFEPDREPTTYTAESEFDGAEVLPGLKFKVAEIFE